jgi:hypothetical protein
MKLLLHIGTHKTGTTALQQFFHANRAQLERCGFYYATPQPSEPDSNLVADALGVGETRVVRTFLTKHFDLARRRGAHTLVVSAEKFYAMSVRSAMQRGHVCSDAIELDRILIEKLQSAVPEGITKSEIVCYVRRPDRYAESLYSQHVKTGIVFDGPFGEFLPFIEPALLYNTCMRLWSDEFGKENCVVRLYEAAAVDIVGDFAVNVLNLDDLAQFACTHDKGNERVGRDLLEFKRAINRTLRFSERDIERAILLLVEEKMQVRMTEPEHYQDFLSPDQRADLLGRLQPEIEALRASHGVPEFPLFDLEGAKASWSRYPGLSQQRWEEIELCYGRINRRVGFRLERLTLRSASRLRRTVPATAVLLDVLKEMGAKRVLHRVLAGMQRGPA